MQHLEFNRCLGVCFCVAVYVFSNRSFKKHDACPCKQHTFVVHCFLPRNLRSFLLLLICFRWYQLVATAC